MRVSLVLVVVALVSLVAPPVPAVTAAPGWTVAFDAEVAGDLAVVGNTVTRCPAEASACRAAELGAANGALNNDTAMALADSDDDPDTVTSSSGVLDLPPGARILHATLSWAGTLRAGSTGLCGRTGQWPPGSPDTVTLAVGEDDATPLPAARFEAAPAPPGADRWYSAHADVTARLARVRGPVGVTVGNVWTGQGFDCAGGWSLTVVWGGDDAPRHRVVVHTGHERVAESPAHTVLRPSGLRAVGGTSKLGVVALEGDRGLGGDTVRVNGVPTPDNFFVAAAPGAREPAHVNNMSVDTRIIQLGPEIVRPADTVVDVVTTAGADHYLLQVLALSVPAPGLAVTTTVDQPVAHDGDPVTQHAVVTNTGAVALHGVDVAFGFDAACGRTLDLAEGETADVTCTGQASTGELTVSAAATDPAGGPLTATATTATRVIHPRLDLAVTAPREVVFTGEQVDHLVTLTNSGDAPLSSVRARVPGCDGVVAETLAPGAAVTTTCTGPATTDPAAGSAVDELGVPVTASAAVPYRIVAVGLAIDVVVPERPVEDGDSVTLTVRVRNNSDVPLTDVEVTGEPAACHRSFPELAVGATTVHTCRVVVSGPTVVALMVSGVPDLPGVPAVMAHAEPRTLTPVARPVTAPPRSVAAVPDTPEPPETQASQPSQVTTQAGPLRESPAHPIAAGLRALGADVSYHDPHVPRFDVDGHPLHRAQDLCGAAARADLTILLQDHQEYHPIVLANASRLLLDTRGKTAGSRVQYL